MDSRKRSTGLVRARLRSCRPPTDPSYFSRRLIEARSLAMHAAIAAKIERQPKLLEIARNNLKRWRARWEDAVPAWHEEWCKILDRPWPEIAAVMMEPDENGARLRQSSPFAGVLSAEERQCIYDAFRLVKESASGEEAETRRDDWLREAAEAISEYNDLIARLSCPRGSRR
jgi:hypothetical protein